MHYSGTVIVYIAPVIENPIFFYQIKNQVKDVSFSRCRKGAPFFTPFQMVFRRLEDAGILSHWQKSVMALRIKENRKTMGQQRFSNIRVVSIVKGYSNLKLASSKDMYFYYHLEFFVNMHE